MPTISLYVVDDHTLFRRGLIALLSQDERLQVIGQALAQLQVPRPAVPADPADLALVKQDRAAQADAAADRTDG